TQTSSRPPPTRMSPGSIRRRLSGGLRRSSANTTRATRSRAITTSGPRNAGRCSLELRWHRPAGLPVSGSERRAVAGRGRTKPVCVAGGTGVLGQRLVPKLVARGHRVTATTTTATKLGLVERMGAQGVVMDGLDPVSVGEAVAAAQPDVIVHQMTGLSLTHA